ncbi:MAG: flippase [Clostridiales bacterium]|nr:flippase [Clostridiales bacterium]
MSEKKSIKLNIVLNIIRQGSMVLFPLILLPYLTRVLQTDCYGRYNRCLNLVNYFSLLGANGIITYSVREVSKLREHLKSAEETANQIYTINVITTVLAYLLLGILLLIWHPSRDYVVLLGIASILVLCQTLEREWVLNVYEDYSFITIRTLVLQSLRVILAFTLVKTKDDVVIYATINTVVAALITIADRIRGRKYLKVRLTKDLEIKKHLKPMLIIFLSTLVIFICQESNITMLGFMKDEDTVGIYSIAAQIFTFTKMIITAVAIVMVPRMTLYINNGNQDGYKELVSKAMKFLIIFSVPTACGIFMVSKEAVLLVAGSGFSDAQIPLQILSAALLFAAFGHFLINGILLVTHNEKKAFLITAIGAISNIALNAVLIPQLGYIGTAATTLFVEGLIAVLGISLAKRNLYVENMKEALIPALIGGAYIVGICILMDKTGMTMVPCLIVKIALSMLGYGCVVLLGNKKLLREIRSSLHL